LKVGPDIHIFFPHSFMLIQSIFINLIASNSSQKISTISVFFSDHFGQKHFMFGSKHMVLVFFGLDMFLIKK